jgi:hypothetical protein
VDVNDKSDGAGAKAPLFHGCAGIRTTADYWPVPDRAAVCAVPPPLSATLSAVVINPVSFGVKVTAMVQFALAARVAGQLLVWL